MNRIRLVAAVFAVAVLALPASAQDRLKSMPGSDRYQRMAPLITTALGGSGPRFHVCQGTATACILGRGNRALRRAEGWGAA